MPNRSNKPQTASVATAVGGDKKTIENHIIGYFALRFDVKPSDLNRDSEVREPFDDRTWAALADTFNSMAWMKQLGVKLSQSEISHDPDTDKDISTIGALADLIARKAGIKIARLSNLEFQIVEPSVWSQR